MKVLLATPAAGEVTVQYASSLAKLIDECARMRSEINLVPKFLVGSVIHRARKVFANLALRDGYTHLLFIDADMGFQPSAVFRLLASGHDVCGCLCPSRKIDERALFLASRQTDDFASAKLRATQFVGHDALGSPGNDGVAKFEVRDGFVQTGSIGMGITLISADTLRSISSACLGISTGSPSAYYQNYGFAEKVHLFFDPYVTAGNEALDEDASFCKRWAESCSGKIYALIDEDITHVGSYASSGNFLKKASLRALSKDQAARVAAAGSL